MKTRSKLSRNEMKAVTGGIPPSCTITCYRVGGAVSYVTIINYPLGTGCSNSNYSCPVDTITYTCSC